MFRYSYAILSEFTPVYSWPAQHTHVTRTWITYAATSDQRLDFTITTYCCILRRSADKFLARPGRKEATETKLVTYSTYSPRSSIHFLARCSNFCKPLKKNQNIFCPTSFPRQQLHHRQKKNGDLSIVHSVQGTGDSPMGQDLENRVGNQDTGITDRPVSSGLQVPGEQGH